MSGSSSSTDVDHLSCAACGYDLYGSAGDRCPWCGARTDLGALDASSRAVMGRRRYALSVTAFLIGVLTLLGLGVMVGRQSKLALGDAIATLGVVLGAAGHLTLGVIAATGGPSWPLRRGEATRVLTFLAFVSILSGVLGGAAVGAGSQVDFSAYRSARGAPLNNFFEGFLAAVLFSLPGWLLLVLRLVSFRRSLSDPGIVSQRPNNSSDPGRAATFVVEAAGPFEPRAVVCEWTNHLRPTTPQIERLIEEAWSTEVAMGSISARPLFDAGLARLIDSAMHQGALHLRLGPARYRDFLGTSVYNAAKIINEAGAAALANPLGVSALVRTSDGYVALGRRAFDSARRSGWLHTFGGILEEGFARAIHGKDPSPFLLKELHEKLALDEKRVTKMIVLGLVRDQAWHQPELLYDVSISLDRNEFLAGCARAGHRHEHVRMECRADEPGELLSLLAVEAALTAIGAAALLLHGRERWGLEWYARACRARFGPGMAV